MPAIKERQEQWVIFHGATTAFVGLRRREPLFTMAYALGDFDGGYKFPTEQAAMNLLRLMHVNRQYLDMEESVLRKLEVRRLRYRIVGIANKGEKYRPSKAERQSTKTKVNKAPKPKAKPRTRRNK